MSVGEKTGEVTQSIEGVCSSGRTEGEILPVTPNICLQ